MKILINAGNVTASGPRVLVSNLLPALLSLPASSYHQFTLLLPDNPLYHALSLPSNAQAHFVAPSHGWHNDLLRIRSLFWSIPHLARHVHADVCLTLGDLGPIWLPCPQVLFLHLSLLVYQDEKLREFAWHPFKRLYLQSHFAHSAKRASAVIVQTPVMAKHLLDRYALDPEQVHVIPQPVPQHLMGIGNSLESSARLITVNDKPIRLLFLSAFYPHKNHQVLPAVVDELRRRNLDGRVHIFTTLDLVDPSSTEIRNHLKKYPDIITNLGSLHPSDVAATMRSSTALFLPTLVESYGLVYLEAMACELPILTSDRDFARWMCGDLALYFDPLSSKSIVDAIEKIPNVLSNRQRYRRQARTQLLRFPKNWETVAERFLATTIGATR